MHLSYFRTPCLNGHNLFDLNKGKLCVCMCLFFFYKSRLVSSVFIDHVIHFRSDMRILKKSQPMCVCHRTHLVSCTVISTSTRRSRRDLNIVVANCLLITEKTIHKKLSHQDNSSLENPYIPSSVDFLKLVSIYQQPLYTCIVTLHLDYDMSSPL